MLTKIRELMKRLRGCPAHNETGLGSDHLAANMNGALTRSWRGWDLKIDKSSKAEPNKANHATSRPIEAALVLVSPTNDGTVEPKASQEGNTAADTARQSLDYVKPVQQKLPIDTASLLQARDPALGTNALAHTCSQDALYLLRLPSEIRDMVLRRPLPRKERIVVDASAIDEPAFLLVCRQLRDEALPVYYLEITFDIVLVDWKSAPILVWQERNLALAYKNSQIPFIVALAGHPHWKNLLRWLERCHCGDLGLGIGSPTTSLKYDPVTTTEMLLINLMLCTISTLRGWPWRYVASVIDEHHAVLAHHNASWK